MKLWKRFGAMALTGAMVLGAMTGCGDSGSAAGGSAGQSGSAYKIGYVNLADTDVFCMARETALSALVANSEYSVSYTDGNNDNQKQIDQVNAFIAKKVNGIIVVPSDSEAITPAVKAANQAGIPVICFGIKANSGDFTFVGSDSYEAGKMQGEFMAGKLEQNANVLYCAGTSGLEHSALRRNGFKDALQEAGRSDITILDDQDCDYTKDKAMKTCDAWVQTYSDGAGGVKFDAIVCANDQMALGCVESLKGAGVLTGAGEILITGVDGTDDAIKAVANGYMTQTVLQDANGQADAAFDVMKKMIAGEAVDKEVIVPFQSITAENAASFQ